MKLRFWLRGSALLAALAISAIAASAAQATPTLGLGEEASLMGTQIGTITFSVEGNKMECTTANGENLEKSHNGDTYVRLHPVYSGCKAFGFAEATVTTTGCNYKHMATGTEKENTYSAEFIVECEAGKEISVTAGTCVVKWGAQTVTTGASVTNTLNLGGGYTDYDLHTTSLALKANKTQDGFLCPFSGTGSTTVVITGTTTVQCTNFADVHVTPCRWQG